MFDQCRGHDKYSKTSIDDDMMNNIYSNCIVGFKLQAKKARNKVIWRLLYVKFDLENEAQNWPITLTDKFINNNSTMIASVGLVASLPLGYIDYLDRLKLDTKTKTTECVQPPAGKVCIN